MKNFIVCQFIINFIICYSFNCTAQSPTEDLNTTNVLFIGNSFSQNNGGVSAVFQDFAEKIGYPVHVEGFFHGGWSVKNFIKNDSCWRMIKSRKWDYIVFQDYQAFYGDTLGKFPPEILEDNIKFQDLIKKFDPGVKIIYVAGWEKMEGFKDRFPGDNFGRLINRIMANYTYLNSQKGVGNIIAPVGLAWLRGMEHEYLDLFVMEDNRHPAHEGTYLYAAVIFTMIYKTNAEISRSFFFKEIKFDTRQFLCNTAYNAVIDTLSYTNMKRHSINLMCFSKLLIATPGYYQYQWFKNDIPIIGANRFYLKRTDLKVKYRLNIITKKKRKLGSLWY